MGFGACVLCSRSAAVMYLLAQELGSFCQREKATLSAVDPHSGDLDSAPLQEPEDVCRNRPLDPPLTVDDMAWCVQVSGLGTDLGKP